MKLDEELSLFHTYFRLLLINLSCSKSLDTAHLFLQGYTFDKAHPTIDIHRTPARLPGEEGNNGLDKLGKQEL